MQRRKKSFRSAILLLLLVISQGGYSQRFIDKNGKAVQISEYSYLDKNSPLDSLFRVRCDNTFEIEAENETRFNRTDELCKRKGYWFYYDHEYEVYAEGKYRRGLKQGIWRYYSNIAKDSLIFEVSYTDGEELKIINNERVDYQKNLFYRTLIKYQITSLIIYLGLIVLHVISNSYLLSLKGINFSFVPIKKGQLASNFIIVFKLFWKKNDLDSKKHSRLVVIAKNTLSLTIIALLVFFLLGSILYPEVIY